MVDSTDSERNAQSTESSTEDLGLEQFESIADDQGISLDELSKAYAELIGKGSDPFTPPEKPQPLGAQDIVDEICSHDIHRPVFDINRQNRDAVFINLKIYRLHLSDPFNDGRRTHAAANA